MKSMRSMCVCAGLAATMMFSTVASAASQVVHVSIPFDFVASGKTMPAGQYSFTNTPTSPVLTLHAANGGTVMALVNYNAGSMAVRADQRKMNLVFEQKDGVYRLKEVSAGIKRAK